MTKVALHTKKIKDLRGKLFYVGNYQRGYKWGIIQVLDLLNDINEFENRGKNFYCLQPIVVKPIEKGRNGASIKMLELIDGQQRMTTIYMILKVLGCEDFLFEIDYQTRKESAVFLEKIQEHTPKDKTALFENYISNKNEKAKKAFENEINARWKFFVEKNNNLNNIDNYHFFRAYTVISHWVKFNKYKVTQFKNNLLEHTKIIWYTIDSNDSPYQIFMNINSGKISLTNAELIKAHFMIDDNKESMTIEESKLKKEKIALEWDKIEYSLQNDEFWYFLVSDKSKFEIPNRIEFIFDLLMNKADKNKSDKYYTFRKYSESNDKGNDWRDVKKIFLTFQEWFEDRELFHYIGFIFDRGFSRVLSIKREYERRTKSNFLIFLKEDIIKKEFHESSVKKDSGKTIYSYDLDSLRYGTRKENKILESILLLFNIETYLVADPNFKFPFNRAKKESWSLEHIHAQNSKSLLSKKALEIWCGGIKKDTSGFNNSKLLNAITDLEIYLKEISGDEIPNSFKEKIKMTQQKIVSTLGEYDNDGEEIHGIENLTLLDRNTNSALSNDVFSRKRKKIIEIDKKGEVIDDKGKIKKAFIPICTKNVFLKYYSRSISEMSTWNKEDRKYYKIDIYDFLKSYLPKNEELEKELLK